MGLLILRLETKMGEILNSIFLSSFQYVCSQHGKITLEKQWSKTPQPFALQATRKDILVHDPSFTQYRTLPELFPVGSICFMLGNPNYGAQGKVVEISAAQKGRISLAVAWARATAKRVRSVQSGCVIHGPVCQP